MARLHPEVWAEFVGGTFSGGTWTETTTYRWATRPLAHAGTYEGGFKEGRAEAWEPIERMLSDPSGHYESSRFGFTVRDTDRLLRGLVGGLDTEHIVNREASIKLISETGAAAGTDPRILARGKIRDPQALDHLRFVFKGEDLIGADLITGTKTVPQRRITRELFPDVHRDLIDKPQPILYGEVSDDGAVDDAGSPAAKGLVPVFWVGTEDIDGTTWDRYLVAGHACKDVHSWFASNLATTGGAERVQMDASTAGVDFLIPGQTGWPFAEPYRDLTDSHGVTHRVTLIYCKGARSEAHKNGSINITVNACGIEDVGDGSGDLIRHAFRVYQHFLHHWVFANDGKGYYTGLWSDLPTWSLAGPTVTVIKTETFADCQTFSGDRLGNGIGYLCDFVLCDDIDIREAVRRFDTALDCYTGINRHAQVIVAMLDDAADTSEATIFRDRIDIREMPPPKIAHDEIENYITFSYDFDADTRKFRADKEFLEDTLAQDALGGEVRKSDELKFYVVRDPATARDAAARRLVRLKRAPRYQEVVLDLAGLEHDLAEFFRVTHYAGLGSAGYEEHPFFCVRHRIDLNTMTVTLTGFDVSRITAVAAPALTDEDGDEDGFVLGDETSSAPPPVGAYELRSSTYTPPAAPPAAVVADAFYLSLAGDDGNDGSEGSPVRTPAAAMALMGPGDTLYLRGGTYDTADDVFDSEAFTMPSGTSGAPITIVGYPGETVIFQPPDGAVALRLTAGAPSYLHFRDFAIDNAHTSVEEVLYVGHGSHHNVFERLDVSNGANFGIVFSDTVANSPYNTVRACTVHDMGPGGTDNTKGHGFYVTTSDGLFEGNHVYDNDGYGFHLYENAGPLNVNRNVIRNNVIHDNGLGHSEAFGVVVAWGTGNLVYNNLMYGNLGGVLVYTNGSSAGIYHNTIVGNVHQGIACQFYSAPPTLRNNIVYGNGSAIVDYGGSAISDHNITVDPLFVDAGSGDYHLQAGSPARGAGVTVSAVTTDYDGHSRTTGGAPDCGAYEYV